jgi:predicted anti-sigma-YlaC factor YlaD
MICRLFRFMISHAADSDATPGPLTQRHLRNCPSCERFHVACRTIAEELRCESARMVRPSDVPPQAILDRLDGRSASTSKVPVRLALAAAACILFAVAGLLLRPRAEEQSPPMAPVQTGDSITWATRVPENPLTTEMQRLAGDVESSARFLVACLDARPALASTYPESLDSQSHAVR